MGLGPHPCGHGGEAVGVGQQWGGGRDHGRAVEGGVVGHHGPAAGGDRAGVGRLVVGGGVRKGTITAGMPAAVSSATVIAPALVMARSAAA